MWVLTMAICYLAVNGDTISCEKAEVPPSDSYYHGYEDCMVMGRSIMREKMKKVSVSTAPQGTHGLLGVSQCQKKSGTSV